MTTQISDDQAMDAVVAARPETDRIESTWHTGRREQVLGQVLASPRADRASVTTHPKHRIRWGLIAAAVALIAAAGLFTQAVMPYGNPGSPQIAQALDRLATAVPTGPVIPAGSYELVKYEDTGLFETENGTGSYQTQRSTWTAADGWAWAHQSGDEAAYYIFAPAPMTYNLSDAPTDPVRMEAYLRDRVTGSSSVEEALFEAIRETLAYTPTSPRTRAAAIRMLAGVKGVTVTENEKDPAGRPATRVTFVDEENRPGETNSMFLDPATAAMLGSLWTRNGRVWNSTSYTERRIVTELPKDIVKMLGTKRVEKAIEQ